MTHHCHSEILHGVCKADVSYFFAINWLLNWKHCICFKKVVILRGLTILTFWRFHHTPPQGKWAVLGLWEDTSATSAVLDRISSTYSKPSFNPSFQCLEEDITLFLTLYWRAAMAQLCGLVFRWASDVACCAQDASLLREPWLHWWSEPAVKVEL